MASPDHNHSGFNRSVLATLLIGVGVMVAYGYGY